jgi:hypothetical protein
MQTTVIVSSPHSLCDPTVKKRECDLAAGLAAQFLCDALRAHAGKIDHIYLQGDEYRRNHDLNRKVSRGTPYRKRLAAVMSAEKFSPRRLLLDVHSFPDEYLDAAGDINFFKKGEVAPNIVLLEGPKDSFDGSSLSRSLWMACLKAGLRSKIITGITVNDIMNQGAEHDIPAVLLEFNEKYLKDPDSLYKICELIAGVIARL